MDSQSIYRQALEQEKAGNWQKAHSLVEHLTSQEAAWIHAYLHRKEGDDWNARYWYSRAGKPFYAGNLEEEWEYIYQHI